MTVEKNGQLAWTFEELDFAGAFKEVEVELMPLYDANQALYELWMQAIIENEEEVKAWIGKKMDKNSERIAVLSPVWDYLFNLIHGVDFNAKA